MRTAKPSQMIRKDFMELSATLSMESKSLQDHRNQQERLEVKRVVVLAL